MSFHWIDKMAVEVDGEGDPVVMVHGLGGTTNTWTPLPPLNGGRWFTGGKFPSGAIQLPGTAPRS